MSGWLVVAIFCILWAATFVPAWWLLLRLLALSAAPQKKQLSFWLLLLSYRLVIAVPYVPLLLVDASIVPDILKGVIVGMLVMGVAFSVIRFYFRKELIDGLWWLYGFVYDGLLLFVPYRRLVDVVVDVATRQKPNARTILELGCGTGNVLHALSRKYEEASITGVDMSRSMLRLARRKVSRARIIQDDIKHFLHQETASYDLIVMQNVLYALSERARVWRDLDRVMSPDGVIVVTNSDRPGSSSITREHLKYGKWYTLLHPKLLMVGIIDSYISQLSKTGSFDFTSEEVIKAEVAQYFDYTFIDRVYGDVNILFVLRKKQNREQHNPDHPH